MHNHPNPTALTAGLSNPERQALRQITSAHSGSFWWPLRDERAGRYVICPVTAHEPMSLAVVDDFGHLVDVPSVGAHDGSAGCPA